MRFLLLLVAAITLSLTCSFVSYAQSAGQPDELEAIYACKLLSDSAQRLSCYDNAVGRFEAAQKSGDVVTISKSEVKKVEQEAFGFNIPSLPKIGKILGLSRSDDEKNAKSVETVESSSNNSTKRVTYRNGNEISGVAMEIEKITKFDAIKKRFYFKNGQIWEQTTGSNLNVPKGPWTAEITKGAIGGYKLKLNGKGWSVKVRRVK